MRLSVIALIFFCQQGSSAILCYEKVLEAAGNYGAVVNDRTSQLDILERVQKEWNLPDVLAIHLAVERVKNVKTHSHLLHLRDDLDHVALRELTTVIKTAVPEHRKDIIAAGPAKLILASVFCLAMSGCNLAAYYQQHEPASLGLGMFLGGVMLTTAAMFPSALTRSHRDQQLEEALVLAQLTSKTDALFKLSPHGRLLPPNTSAALGQSFRDEGLYNDWQLFVATRIPTEGEPESVVLQTRW